MLLTVNNITFKYNDSQVFKFGSFELNKKESLLVLGNSGKGKTTLLHLLSGLLDLESGSIYLNGTEFSKLKGQKRDFFRGRHIGIVFQKAYFIKSLNALENIKLACLAANQHFDSKYATTLFEKLNLAGKENKYTYQLSTGEQQRFNIIRALINKPDLLLADEPTSSLDDDNCREVVNALKEAASVNNTALIIVTHDQRLKSEFSNVLEL